VRNDLNSGLEMSAALAAVLKQYIASHNVVKPDIWAEREVTDLIKQEAATSADGRRHLIEEKRSVGLLEARGQGQ
jgi:hypothetical protein